MPSLLRLQYEELLSETVRLREALAVLTSSVERDRREADKILCHVQTARRALAETGKREP